MTDDLRFVYNDDGPPWRSGGKQYLQRTDFITMEPKHNLSAEGPLSLKWDLKSRLPLLFDWNSRFAVEGEFQTRDGEGDAWKSCTSSESAKVMVAPSWWDCLIRQIKLITPKQTYYRQHFEPFDDVGNYHLEHFLYWAMDPMLKKQLCYEKCHPANAVSNLQGDWTFNTDETQSSWEKYSKSIFVDGPIKFHWTPLFFWPFFQGSNHVYDSKGVPRCLPLPYIGDMQVQIDLRKDFNNIIFKKRGAIPATATEPAVEACTKEYRFHLLNVDLVCEQAKLNPLAEKTLFQFNQKPLSYLGVTKNVRAEHVPGQTNQFRSTFRDICMPEGVLIYVLPRSFANNKFKFSDWNEKESFWLKHNIKSVDFVCGGITLDHSVIHLGDVNNEFLDMKRKMLYEQLGGPFGMKFATNKITPENLKDSWAHTDFPHVFFNLCPSGPNSRIHCQSDSNNNIDGSSSSSSSRKKKQDFTVLMTFEDQGAVADATYFVTLYYTGTNMQLNLKEKKCVNPIFA